MGAADVMSALPDSAVCVQGVGYPMFRTKALADAATRMGTSHAMKVGHMDKYTLYMPNGNLQDALASSRLTSASAKLRILFDKRWFICTMKQTSSTKHITHATSIRSHCVPCRI